MRDEGGVPYLWRADRNLEGQVFNSGASVIRPFRLTTVNPSSWWASSRKERPR